MKNLRTSFLIVTIMGVAITSCADKKKDKEPEVIEVETHTTHQTKEDITMSSINFDDDAIAAVYQHYIHIKMALVKTDAAESKNGGKMLAEALSKVEGFQDLKDAVNNLVATDDVEQQRVAFSPISDALAKLIEGHVTSGEVYHQYCPMAFDFKGGYWLSSEKEIRNPYFGDKMLKCGEVKATIK